MNNVLIECYYAYGVISVKFKLLQETYTLISEFNNVKKFISLLDYKKDSSRYNSRCKFNTLNLEINNKICDIEKSRTIWRDLIMMGFRRKFDDSKSN